MKAPDLTSSSVEQLVTIFTEIALAQDRAELEGEIRKYNKLFDAMQLLKTELKRREGDQRSALVPLLQHKNAQVRLMAAYATEEVALAEARATFEALAVSKIYPQAANAGMALDRLDGKGIFEGSKPPSS
jgi:hypothetical protein